MLSQCLAFKIMGFGQFDFQETFSFNHEMFLDCSLHQTFSVFSAISKILAYLVCAKFMGLIKKILNGT